MPRFTAAEQAADSSAECGHVSNPNRLIYQALLPHHSADGFTSFRGLQALGILMLSEKVMERGRVDKGRAVFDLEPREKSHAFV